VTDPIASQLNDIQDIERVMPGYLEATRRWFKVYKMPTGKPCNKFAFNGEFKNRDFALQIIEQTHKQWQSLIGNHSDCGKTRCENTTVLGSPYLVTVETAENCLHQAKQVFAGDTLVQKAAAGDMWHFVRD